MCRLDRDIARLETRVYRKLSFFFCFCIRFLYRVRRQSLGVCIFILQYKCYRVKIFDRITSDIKGDGQRWTEQVMTETVYIFCFF